MVSFAHARRVQSDLAIFRWFPFSLRAKMSVPKQLDTPWRSVSLLKTK